MEFGFQTPQKNLNLKISNFSVVFEPNSKFPSLRRSVFALKNVFQVKKDFGSKKFLGQKNLGQKKILSKKFLVQTNLFGQKNCFWVKKVFWVKKFFAVDLKMCFLSRNSIYRVHIGDIAQYCVHIARILKKISLRPGGNYYPRNFEIGFGEDFDQNWPNRFLKSIFLMYARGI